MTSKFKYKKLFVGLSFLSVFSYVFLFVSDVVSAQGQPLCTSCSGSVRTRPTKATCVASSWQQSVLSIDFQGNKIVTGLKNRARLFETKRQEVDLTAQECPIEVDKRVCAFWPSPPNPPKLAAKWCNAFEGYVPCTFREEAQGSLFYGSLYYGLARIPVGCGCIATCDGSVAKNGFLPSGNQLCTAFTDCKNGTVCKNIDGKCACVLPNP